MDAGSVPGKYILVWKTLDAGAMAIPEADHHDDVGLGVERVGGGLIRFGAARVGDSLLMKKRYKLGFGNK